MEIKDIAKEAVMISENASLREAIELMLNSYTNTLLVIDDEGTLVGEVGVSDLFDGIIPMNLDGDKALAQLQSETGFAEAVRDAAEKPVFEFMTAGFDTVRPDSTIMDVAAIAIAQGQARIPVVDHDNHPVGMISRQGLKQILGTYLA